MNDEKASELMIAAILNEECPSDNYERCMECEHKVQCFDRMIASSPEEMISALKYTFKKAYGVDFNVASGRS